MDQKPADLYGSRTLPRSQGGFRPMPKSNSVSANMQNGYDNPHYRQNTDNNTAGNGSHSAPTREGKSTWYEYGCVWAGDSTVTLCLISRSFISHVLYQAPCWQATKISYNYIMCKLYW